MIPADQPPSLSNRSPASALFGPAHPLRAAVVNEVHSRPYDPATAPLRLSYLALITGEPAGATVPEREREHFKHLCGRYDVAPPAEGAKHFIQDFGPFKLRWERHTEFCTYTFIRPGPFADPFADPVINLVPREWRDAIPGEVLVAAHLAFDAANAPERDPEALSRLFNHHTVLGSVIAGGSAEYFTDLRPDDDGFTRFLLRDRGISDRRAGRSIQRLLEINTYTQMAVLGLPLAQAMAPRLGQVEKALGDLSERLGRLEDVVDERALLDAITALAGEVERIAAATSYRFSASEAYAAIVRSRLSELREERAGGYERLSIFLDRRLWPAIRTCEATAARIDGLAHRVARASTLLRTRVDVALEAQNQQLLEAINRRAQLQLRLQATVEGLSAAAISYYVLGLIAYAAKAIKAGGVALDVDLVTGLAIPVVVGLVWFGVRHARGLIGRDED